MAEIKSMTGFEACTIEESREANNGEAIRFLDWTPRSITFHRADRSTNGRTVNAGPKEIFVRKIGSAPKIEPLSSGYIALQIARFEQDARDESLSASDRAIAQREADKLKRELGN